MFCVGVLLVVLRIWVVRQLVMGIFLGCKLGGGFVCLFVQVVWVGGQKLVVVDYGVVFDIDGFGLYWCVEDKGCDGILFVCCRKFGYVLQYEVGVFVGFECVQIVVVQKVGVVEGGDFQCFVCVYGGGVVFQLCYEYGLLCFEVQM